MDIKTQIASYMESLETINNSSLHYLDNAATVFPKPQEVVDFAIKVYQEIGVNPGRTTFDLGLEAEDLIFRTRDTLNHFFGGGPNVNRVVFGYNVTDALNLVIFGLLQKGGHVVTTMLEHNSVLRPIQHCYNDFGAHATYIPFDQDGYIDPDDIKKAIQKDTKLVIVNHGSNVLGTVQPIAEIGAICKNQGIIFCIDAAQTAGLIPIHMEEMDIDIVAFTGHKSLLGFTGIGGLCVGEDIVIPLSRAGGTGVRSLQKNHLEEYPFRLEYGTPNILGIASLLAGVGYIMKKGGPEAIHKREMDIANPLWYALTETELPNIIFYGSKKFFKSLERRIPTLAFNIEGQDPAKVGTILDVDFNVACRTGLHCAPRVHEQLGTLPYGSVRLSIGPFTTKEDIDAALEGLSSFSKGIGL